MAHDLAMAHVDCSAVAGLSEAARDPLKLWCPELGEQSTEGSRGCVFFRCVLCSKLGVKISRSRAVSSDISTAIKSTPALLFILSRLLKRSLRAARLRLFCVIKAQRKHQCVLCPRAKWCLPAPLARQPFASLMGQIAATSPRLAHPTPSPPVSFSAPNLPLSCVAAHLNGAGGRAVKQTYSAYSACLLVCQPGDVHVAAIWPMRCKRLAS